MFTEWNVTNLFNKKKFKVKWMEVGTKVILNEVIQTLKYKYGKYSLICRY